MEGQNEGADTKKLVGMFLLGFAIVDFGGSWVGFDLWGTIGIPLPGFLWSYSAIIEGGIAGLYWVGLMEMMTKPSTKKSDLCLGPSDYYL